MTKAAFQLKQCPSCSHFVARTALVNGECADCAGLMALPLRTADGRFMALPKIGTKGLPAMARRL